MNEVLETYKKDLKALSKEFLEFLCHYFGFDKTEYSQGYIQRQLAPWFNPPNELTIDQDKKFDTYSQYFSEYVQQKYRLALEFCADKAGVKDVIKYDAETLMPVSGGLFWLKGCHPNDVAWLLLIDNKVIARGYESPNTLNIETMEDWLLDRMAGLSRRYNESKSTGKSTGAPEEGFEAM